MIVRPGGHPKDHPRGLQVEVQSINMKIRKKNQNDLKEIVLNHHLKKSPSIEVARGKFNLVGVQV